MHRFAAVLLCTVGVLAVEARGQSGKVEGVHAPAGTVLAFHLQTRLNPADRNEMDVLPRGTVIRVKLLSGVDSSVDRDGSEFHGEVVESVSEGSRIIVHSESEVRGILVLLRSRNHPEGFRYELLVTSLRDHEKTYDVTASLNPSFFDGGAQPAAISKAEVPTETKTAEAGGARLTSPLHN
ncbi:MAG TPA: hypothetical protein VFI38_07525 [Candidatus Acidoferrum sp.]|nr:hypothetical protein [Candidatus Acidoferrum sp.]